MNKLEIIIEDIVTTGIISDLLNYHIADQGEPTEKIKELLRDKFVEYARSVLPPDGDSVRGFHSGTNLTIIKIENRIDQDLLSLKEKLVIEYFKRFYVT